jgi:large subunit ribosomal protein L20
LLLAAGGWLLAGSDMDSPSETAAAAASGESSSRRAAASGGRAPRAVRKEIKMPRVKRGNVRRAKRKKLLSRAKGFYQTKSKLYRSAKESVDTALKYAYVGRRNKKRDFRRLWVIRINAAARENGLTYGQLIAGLKAAGNPIDRKTLADLAVTSPAAFAQLAKIAGEARPKVARRATA